MSKQQILQLGRGALGYFISDNCYRVCVKTGVIAAAQPAESIFLTVCPAQLNAPPGPAIVAIERIRVQYTTITAFTTPVTAGRSLAFAASQSGPNATGGTLLESPVNKGSSFETSYLDDGFGAQVMVADTAGLGNVTVQANRPRFAELSLAAFGAAGATVDKTWEFSCSGADPLIIGTGGGGHYNTTRTLVLFNPAAMDAAGTFEVLVEIDVCELPQTFPFPS